MVGYRKEIEKRRNYLDKINSEIFEFDSVKIEYLLQGDGPTILISHGLSGGINQGILLANNYIAKEVRFLFISRFGYLKSSMPSNPSVELQADVYKELLDHLGIKKVILYGNSAGSTSVLQFAIKYPNYCCGLILQAPNAPLEHPAGTPPKFVFKYNYLYWVFLKLFGGMMTSMFLPKKILKTIPRKERIDIMDEVFFAALPITKRTKGIIFDAYISNPSVNELTSLNTIKTPTLILNSKDDPATIISGARTLAKEIQNSILIELPSGGHLFYRQEENVRSEIEKFISEHMEACF